MIVIKILIFGNYNPFTLSLISRLNREDHSIFLVTEDVKKNKIKSSYVFQEYNFSYNSESLSTIINNINPEIVIIAGIMGGFFESKSSSNKIPNHLGGITNIMLNLKQKDIKKIIYLSSLSIFKANNEVLIDENTKPIPYSNVEKALLLGEDICRKYSIDEKFNLIILRLGQVYGSYNNDYLENNICSEICEQVIKNKKVKIVEKRSKNIIYIDDAVDAIYKVLNSKLGKHNIYHIASFKEVSEKEIVSILESKLKSKKILKVIEKNSTVQDKKYSNKRIESIGFKEKYNIDDKIESLYNIMKKKINSRKKETNEKSSILSRVFKIDDNIKSRVFPFFENFVFFIFINIFLYSTKTKNFHEVIDFHLIYVIIIGLIYGYKQSIFAIILSVLSKTYISLFWDTQIMSIRNDLFYIWILELFSLGLLVGYLKEQYKLKFSDMADEKEYLNIQLKDIREINKSNEEIKEIYENRLVNYKDSFGRIYEIVSELELIEPKAIIFKSVKVIEDIMYTNDVSIYMYSGSSSFFRLIASSAKKTINLKTSLKVSEYRTIFEKLEKKEIYINGTLDPKYPIMAGGVYKGDILQSIIMIWSLPFEKNNLYQMNIFGVACKLIEGSLNVAYEYMSSISKSYKLKYDNVLDEESFEKILELYKSGKKEGIVDFILLKVEKSKEMTRETFLETLKRNLRETDYIGAEKNSQMKVILSNTNKEGSKYVISRLEANKIIVLMEEVN